MATRPDYFRDPRSKYLIDAANLGWITHPNNWPEGCDATRILADLLHKIGVAVDNETYRTLRQLLVNINHHGDDLFNGWLETLEALPENAG